MSSAEFGKRGQVGPRLRDFGSKRAKSATEISSTGFPVRLVNGHAADSVEAVADGDQGQALKRRTAWELFPRLAILEVQPAKVPRCSLIIIFMCGADMAAVNIEPVAQDGPTEAVDRLGKQCERRGGWRGRRGLAGAGDGERRIVADFGVRFSVRAAGRLLDPLDEQTGASFGDTGLVDPPVLIGFELNGIAFLGVRFYDCAWGWAAAEAHDHNRPLPCLLYEPRPQKIAGIGLGGGGRLELNASCVKQTEACRRRASSRRDHRSRRSSWVEAWAS